jgi:hypothetical protein
MAVELSICICTTSERSEIIKPLLNNLTHQILGYEDSVEVLIDNHETDCVGKKRNNLLRQSQGKYVVAIDSDDHVSDDYISLILTAIKSNPDCIGISGWVTTNGNNKCDWHISKDYGKWYQVGNVYYRTPNHISPIKREIALKAMFPEIRFAEDYEFSMRVLPYLKTEVKISNPIYHYDYWQK